MIELKTVTLVCIDTRDHSRAIMAIRKCLKQVKFARAVFLTDMDISIPDVEVIKIEPIKSKREYSEFCIKKLYKYFDTSHVLVVQWDGYILDAGAWDDEYLKYDYIGAPWIYDERNVGNGGFSLRSRKLQYVLVDNFIDVLHPEDQSICILYRYYLEEKYGVKFAPFELAEKFAYESLEPIQSTFGFHNFNGSAYKPVVVIKRTAAMGDVIAVEPVIDYYVKNGYRVFLDTLPQFFYLFMYYKYQIEHISQMNPRLQHTVVDLDMAYESKPKQLHLKSYYEKAGITDGEIRRPQLGMKLDANSKQFPNKTAVIHYNRRAQGGRNIYDINWNYLVGVLRDWGYDVIQVGAGEHQEIGGVLSINTPQTNMLLYTVASCDLFVGADSGVSHVAVAAGVPSVIFFGSVKAEYIHPDLSNICVIENGPVCILPHCWHEVENGTEGMECLVDEQKPPCATFDTETVIDKIYDFINKR
jgi:ADP-heptose:LPS heptosyltransferase